MPDIQVATKPSIGSIIRTIIDGSGPLEASEVADAVLASIDPDDYGTYLRELIVSRVSTETGRLRDAVTPPIRKGVSTKQSLIRNEYWPQFLRQKIALPGGYKTLAEATSADLRFIADMRKTQANDLLNKADQFNTLADLMDKAKVTYLEGLDRKAGQSVLEQAA